MSATQTASDIRGTSVGVMKWFNPEKGYGFVKDEGNDEEYFVHFSEIQMGGYKSLNEGDRVSFEIAQGPKGLQAKTVRLLEGNGPRREAPARPSLNYRKDEDSY
jgi:cold shock protein